jgi:hypothetical protein
VSIRIAGNPIPFAIGKSETDGQMVEVLRQDSHPGWKKGRCVSIVQIFGDQLWQQCRDRLRGAEIVGVSDPMTIAYPNAGFSRQTLSITSIETERESALTHQTPAGGGGGGAPTAAVSVEVDSAEAMSELSLTGDQVKAQKMSGESESEEAQQGKRAEEEEKEEEVLVNTPIPIETMDTLLMVCLLRTLKYLIKDKDLPLLTSSLWSIVTKSVILCPLPTSPFPHLLLLPGRSYPLTPLCSLRGLTVSSESTSSTPRSRRLSLSSSISNRLVS